MHSTKRATGRSTAARAVPEGAPLQALLVPLDGSTATERAVLPAARLARQTGAPLTLFHWDFDAREGALTGSYLEMLADGLGVTADVEVVVNAELPQSIAAAAADRGATICMATHGRGGVSRAVLGSVAEEVLHLIEQPALLVGPHFELVPSARVGRFVVCMDGSELSELGLPAAVAWARQLGAPIELVHVLDSPAVEGFPTGASDLIDSGYLQRVVGDLDVADASFEVLHGPAALAIARHAGPEVELVAVTTHGRTGVPRVALGSVAMGVAHRSRRPVLVVPGRAT